MGSPLFWPNPQGHKKAIAIVLVCSERKTHQSVDLYCVGGVDFSFRLKGAPIKCARGSHAHSTIGCNGLNGRVASYTCFQEREDVLKPGYEVG